MAKDPLDYFNPHARPEPAPQEPPPLPPMPVVPVEFDATLTETEDHAALTVIETALKAAKIPFHRVAADAVARRQITLWVHGVDQERASVLAAGVFARRQRVKTLLPPKPPEPDDDRGLLSGFGDVDL